MKIKKQWKKFKTWLIIKLGGHPSERIITVEHHQIPVVSYNVTVTLDPTHPKFNDEEWIKEHLAHKCIDIIKEHIEIRYCEDIFDYPRTRTYEGTIRLGEKRK